MLILEERKIKRKVTLILIFAFCVIWLFLGAAYLTQRKDTYVKEETTFISPPFYLSSKTPVTPEFKKNNAVIISPSPVVFSSCGKILEEINKIFEEGNHCEIDSHCGFKGTSSQQNDIQLDCGGGYVPISINTDIITAGLKIKQYKKECGLFCMNVEPLPEMGKPILYKCINNKCVLK